MLESAELSGVDKPVVEGQEDSTNLPPDVGAVDPLHGFVPADVPSAPTQVKPLNPVQVLVLVHADLLLPVFRNCPLLEGCSCPVTSCPLLSSGCSCSRRTKVGFLLGQSGRWLR